jgi:hypothetical protein
MPNATDSTSLHMDMAGLRADLQSTNRNVERIASSLEKITDDHEQRLRGVERQLVARDEFEAMRKENQTQNQAQRDFMNKMLGIGLVVNFVGLGAIAFLFTHYK